MDNNENAWNKISSFLDLESKIYGFKVDGTMLEIDNIYNQMKINSEKLLNKEIIEDNLNDEMENKDIIDEKFNIGENICIENKEIISQKNIEKQKFKNVSMISLMRLFNFENNSSNILNWKMDQDFSLIFKLTEEEYTSNNNSEMTDYFKNSLNSLIEKKNLNNILEGEEKINSMINVTNKDDFDEIFNNSNIDLSAQIKKNLNKLDENLILNSLKKGAFINFDSDEKLDMSDFEISNKEISALPIGQDLNNSELANLNINNDENFENTLNISNLTNKNWFTYIGSGNTNIQNETIPSQLYNVIFNTKVNKKFVDIMDIKFKDDNKDEEEESLLLKKKSKKKANNINSDEVLSLDISSLKNVPNLKYKNLPSNEVELNYIPIDNKKLDTYIFDFKKLENTFLLQKIKKSWINNENIVNNTFNNTINDNDYNNNSLNNNTLPNLNQDNDLNREANTGIGLNIGEITNKIYNIYQKSKENKKELNFNDIYKEINHSSKQVSKHNVFLSILHAAAHYNFELENSKSNEDDNNIFLKI